MLRIDYHGADIGAGQQVIQDLSGVAVVFLILESKERIAVQGAFKYRLCANLMTTNVGSRNTQFPGLNPQKYCILSAGTDFHWVEMRLTATNFIKLYFSTLAAFLAIDMIWLGLVARDLYARYLGYLFGPQTIWPAAAAFYLLYIVGVLVFAVLPGLRANSPRKTLLLGAFLGLVSYATYDLTNLATIQGWPVHITLIDLTWGTALTCLTSWIGFLAGSRIAPQRRKVNT